MPKNKPNPSHHPDNPETPEPAPLPCNILNKDDEALEKDRKLRELENRPKA